MVKRNLNRARPAGWLLAGSVSLLVAGLMTPSALAAKGGGNGPPAGTPNGQGKAVGQGHQPANGKGNSGGNGNGGQPAGGNGNGGVGPGSRGTVKIEGVAFDGGKDNDPHVTCPFQVTFWGFEPGTRHATVSFVGQHPSATAHGRADTPVPATPDNSATGTPLVFTGSGDPQTLDAAQTYTLDTTGLAMQPNQGFHVKVSVLVDGSHAHHGQGTFKHKVFWMSACPTPSTPTKPPTTQPGGNNTTNTTNTVTPVLSPTPVPSVTESPAPGGAPVPAVSGETTQRTPPSTQVLGVTVARNLPFTGPPPVGVLAAGGLGLVFFGIGLVDATRRRRTSG